MTQNLNSQTKSFSVTFLLCFLLGGLGIHRFYTGYIGIGILQLLTFGGCGIWSLIDLIFLAFNNYKDANGRELTDYNKNLAYIVLGILAVLIILGAVTIF